jgi:ribose transport system ATP-binding protein
MTASAPLPSSAPVIEARGLEKSFPGVRALRGVDFDLVPGEVHALMGENGAGKSTLMKILAGVYQPDAGQVRVDGRAVNIDGPRAAQALGIGIIHQELNLAQHLTAAANVFLGREPRKFGVFVDEAKMSADARALFQANRLPIDPDQEVERMTVARQQLIEIAKALSAQSRVLIMDEPTAALNAQETSDLFAIIRRLKAQGVAIVYISHKMDELFAISDRITVMRDGAVVGTRVAAQTTMDEVIRMMVGRDLERREAFLAPPADAPIALEIKGLSRGRAVRDVTFHVRKGEIVGFAGLMGAGRTETARVVFGADPAERGTIKVDGREVSIRTPADGVRAGIGYLSEDRKRFGLALPMDVEANATMTRLEDFLGPGPMLRKDKLRETAADYVRKLAIKTPSLDQEARLLSGGNQQKIVIAKWLLRDCGVLFFDEPTRGIDVGAKAEIYKLIEALAAQGKAIVVISSELPEVLRLSHRVVVMCEGRVTGELDAKDATEEAIMRLATARETTELTTEHAA